MRYESLQIIISSCVDTIQPLCKEKGFLVALQEFAEKTESLSGNEKKGIEVIRAAHYACIKSEKLLKCITQYLSRAQGIVSEAIRELISNPSLV